MKTLLTAGDAEVIAVADPEAAIEALEAAGRPVTGLLVDYHLDRGNGLAAIRDIRRRFGDNVPAILITADRSPHVRAAAREENIVVLNKPVKPASLRARSGSGGRSRWWRRSSARSIQPRHPEVRCAASLEG